MPPYHAGQRAYCSGSVTDRPGFPDRCDSPDNVADVIRDQHSTALIDSDTDRSAVSIAIFIDKTCQDIHRFAAGLAILEWHKNYLVTAQRFPIPGSVLTDKGAATVLLWQKFALVECQANGSSM
jgi:hypothetical protein